MAKPEIRLKGFEGEWKTSPLIELCIINPSSTLPDSFEYVDLESVVGTEMISHRKEYKNTAPSRAQRLAKDGDIFYQTVRPYQKNNYMFKDRGENYVFSTGYAQLRTDLIPPYLFNILQSDSFVNQVLLNCTGTSYPAINPSNLSRLLVTYSENRNEQIAIAAYFKSLDSMIQATTKKIASLKQMKSASLISMFPQAGETTPRVRFKGFEGEWEDVSFKDISYLAGTKNRDNLPLESYSISNEFGFIPQNEQFENGGTMSNADKRMYYIVTPDSFAYNPARINVGSIGYDDLDKDVIVSSLYVVFKTDNDTYNPFLNYWFKTPIFKKMIELYQEGGVRLYFFYDKLCNCHFRRPSVNEQQRIASYFRSLDKQISLQEQRLEKLKQIKAACLDKMFV